MHSIYIYMYTYILTCSVFCKPTFCSSAMFAVFGSNVADLCYIWLSLRPVTMATATSKQPLRPPPSIVYQLNNSEISYTDTQACIALSRETRKLSLRVCAVWSLLCF